MYIRVDGNEIIATGHIMRCLSIAEALREMGEDSIFILADDRPKEMIEKRGFKVSVLNSPFDDLNQEIEIMIEYIKKNHIKKLLIDTYYVTYDYLIELRKFTNICYIDDLNAFAYPINQLVNYGFMVEERTYLDKYKKDQKLPCLYIGCQYVPLRKEFQNIDYIVRSKVKNVLITTGGTDLYNVAGNILKKIVNEDKFKDIQFHVVAGKFNKNLEVLYQTSLQNSNIIVYKNISNMGELMQKCDLAITAGGSTTFELCAIGVPSICLSIADNQKQGVQNWARKGIMFCAGDMETNSKECIQNVIQYLKKYIDDFSLRKEKSKKMRSLVDGNGAKRIAQILQMEEKPC